MVNWNWWTIDPYLIACCHLDLFPHFLCRKPVSMIFIIFITTWEHHRLLVLQFRQHGATAHPIACNSSDVSTILRQKHLDFSPDHSPPILARNDLNGWSQISSRLMHYPFQLFYISPPSLINGLSGWSCWFTSIQGWNQELNFSGKILGLVSQISSRLIQYPFQLFYIAAPPLINGLWRWFSWFTCIKLRNILSRFLLSLCFFILILQLLYMHHRENLRAASFLIR